MDNSSIALEIVESHKEEDEEINLRHLHERLVDNHGYERAMDILSFVREHARKNGVPVNAAGYAKWIKENP